MDLDPFVGVLTHDLETASACNLQAVGAWAYSQHPSTDVLCGCFAYRARPGAPYVYIDWTPGGKLPGALLEYLRGGGVIVAHNAAFEKSIHANILVPHYGWPEIDPDQWRDTAALGLCVNQPLKLEGLAKALGCETQKDMEGHALMLEMAKVEPDGEGGWIYDRDPGRTARLVQYCRTDCGATLDCYARLPALSVTEALVYRVDQKINARGVWLDQEFAAKCAEMAAARSQELSDETFAATGGELLNSTGAPALKKWIARLGVQLPTVKKKGKDGEMKVRVTADKNAVLSLLARGELSDEVRTVLENRMEANKATSLSKLKRVPDMVGSDGRLRYSLTFHGALTGRWTSGGLQLHNLPRVKMGEGEAALVRHLIQDRSLEGMKMAQANVLDSISQSLRSVLAAPPGRELVAADYSAIEARVIAWLAGQENLLEQFRLKDEGKAGDVYVFAANMIGSTNRQLGKVVVLALGYGMGALKFAVQVAQAGIPITLKEARRIQKEWRKTIDKIVDFWAAIEDACRDAISDEGRAYSCAGGKIVALVRNSTLYVRLPSGRAIRYYRPRVVPCTKKIETVDDEGNIVTREMVTNEIRFFTMAKDKSSMVLESTYGGKLAENVTQAVSRELLAGAMVRIDKVAPYDLVVHVHDSLAAEVPLGGGSVDEFCALMKPTEPWAAGLPVGVEGYRGQYFEG